MNTALFNKVLKEAQMKRSVPLPGGKKTKLMYGTQVGLNPPKFLIFASHIEGIPKEYLRYLQGIFRKELPYKNIPVALEFRELRKKDDRHGDGGQASRRQIEKGPEQAQSTVKKYNP